MSLGGGSPFSKITRHRWEETGRAGVQPTAVSRSHINTHAFAAFHSPIWVAAHDLGNPAGRAAAAGIDRNRDGNINGKDYVPGQFAAEAAAVDINSNGWTNGQDYAPGQLPLHSDA